MTDPRFARIEHNGEVRTPTVAICRIDSCKFEWPVAYTPMSIETWAKLAQKAMCPMCGDNKPLLKGNGQEDKPDLTMTLPG